MAILAYRYEGLRWGDFTLLMSQLFEVTLHLYFYFFLLFVRVARCCQAMASENGNSYADRPSCVKYARWVALAGGRVRRTHRAELLNEVHGTSTVQTLFIQQSFSFFNE